MSTIAAQFPRPPSKILMLLEGRALHEFRAFLSVIPLLNLADKGDGHPVLVLPGLMAGDDSTIPLRQFLKGRGYDVRGWGLGLNRGLRDGVQGNMLDLVRDFSDVHGRKISIVGLSLGGIYARELAKMLPDRVRSVITLGSPFAGDPKSTNAWRVYELASGQSTPRTMNLVARLKKLLQYRPPRFTAVRMESARGKPVSKKPLPGRKASRSKEAIAEWPRIQPLRSRLRTGFPSLRARGSPSIAVAGGALSSPTRFGRRRRDGKC